jgi:predicted nucleotidyltransferase
VTSDGSERLTPGSSTIDDRADSHWRESDASPRVGSYVEAVTDAGAGLGCSLASVILFGSTATGGFSATASDLDLILVLGHDAARDDRRRLCEEVERLEVLHGFRRQRVRAQSSLERLIDRLTGTVHSFFICTRQDLLSGRVERILGIPPLQALFVDRVVIPSIVGSAVTVWGEDLLPHVPLLPIRRFDVLKSFHGLFCLVMLVLAIYPVLPDATKYAMAALKRSVHNCFFCYHGHPAKLEQEIGFFQERIGFSRTLQQLLDLRREYAHSVSFVARCAPTLIRLHLRTAKDNQFPREVSRHL